MLSCDSPERQLEFLLKLGSLNSICKAPKGTELTHVHATHQERRIVLLQSTLLLLKLVTFMSAVEAKSSSADVAKEVLWNTLAIMVEREESELICPEPEPARNPAAASSQHWTETERDVSVPLAALLCTTLRQHILQPTIQAGICCSLIDAVLLESSDVIDSDKAQSLAAIFKSKGMSFFSSCSSPAGHGELCFEGCKRIGHPKWSDVCTAMICSVCLQSLTTCCDNHTYMLYATLRPSCCFAMV